MLKPYLLLLIPFLLTSIALKAQTHKIVGSIEINNGNPLPNATVILRSFADSILIGGTSTDSNGKFILENINSGKYKLSVSHMGFAPYTTQLQVLNKDLFLNNIVLSSKEGIKLDSVTINRQRPLLTRSIDKLVLNVEGSVYERGENGLRLFNIIPGVQVIGKDIKYRGVENVTVYVDNRKLVLPPEQLEIYLRGIPSESIKSYELKAVPGAENDAQHGGVIINIVLKSEYKYGLTGNVGVRYWINDNNNGSASMSLNYRVGKFTAQSSFNYQNSAAYFQDKIYQEFKSTGVYNIQDDNYKEKYHSINFNFGFDYRLTDKQTIGINYNLLRNPGDFSNYTNNITDFFADKSHGNPDSTWISRKNTTFKYTSQMVNAFYRIKLDSTVSRLDIGYSYIGYDLDDPSRIETSFLNSEKVESRPRDSIFAYNNGKSHAHVFNIDLEKKLSKSLQINAGAKYTSSNTNYLMDYRFGLDKDSPLDTNRSNQFLYNEKIFAIYGSITKSFDKWQVKFGLRTEKTKYDGVSVTSGEEIDRSRWDWFPSAFVNRKIGDDHSLTFSYARRIDRPGFRQLNPFTFYLSRNNLWQGNPNLKPYYANNIQLEYLLKNRYSLSLGYQTTDDGIARLVTNEGEIVITREDNINDYRNLFLSFNVPLKLTKWWEMNFSTTFRNSSINLHTVPQVKRTKFNQYFWANSKFNLPKKYFIEISGNYANNEFSDIYDAKNVGKLDITVRKSFFNDKLTTSLELMDPFHFYKLGQTIDNEAINRSFVRNKIDWGRYIGFNLTYNFSNGKKTTDRESISAPGNDVRGRL